MRKQVTRSQWENALIVVAVAAIFGVLLCYAVSFARAAEPAGFSDLERVVRFLDRNPYEAARLLESVLTQEAIDGLESRMFPPPSVAEQRDGLVAVERRLKELGLRVDDPLVAAVEGRIAEMEEATGPRVGP